MILKGLKYPVRLINCSRKKYVADKSFRSDSYYSQQNASGSTYLTISESTNTLYCLTRKRLQTRGRLLLQNGPPRRSLYQLLPVSLHFNRYKWQYHPRNCLVYILQIDNSFSLSDQLVRPQARPGVMPMAQPTTPYYQLETCYISCISL